MQASTDSWNSMNDHELDKKCEGYFSQVLRNGSLSRQSQTIFLRENIFLRNNFHIHSHFFSMEKCQRSFFRFWGIKKQSKSDSIFKGNNFAFLGNDFCLQFKFLFLKFAIYFCVYKSVKDIFSCFGENRKQSVE